MGAGKKKGPDAGQIVTEGKDGTDKLDPYRSGPQIKDKP